MTKVRFHLFNSMHGETIANVEMDEELLAEEAGIVDPETLTLRPIKNGGVYTLIPVEDHTVAVLRAIREAYSQLTNEPIPLPTSYLSRVDALVSSTGLLFDQIKYVVVEGPEDIDKLINPPEEEYVPKTVEYDILGDLADQLDPEPEKAPPGDGNGLEDTDEAEDA